MTDHRPYRPSNGTEGDAFMARWCASCERDRRHRETGDPDEACPVATASFAYDVNDADYPAEWREDGPAGPRCTAYAADTVTPPRCPETLDLFGEG